MNEKTPRPLAGYLLWAAAMVIMGIMGTLYFVAQRNIPNPEPGTLCDKNHDVAGITVIVVDRTDALTPAQLGHVRIYIEKAISEMKPNTVVALFGIQQDNEGVVAASFCRCRPPKEDQINRIIQGPAVAAARYEDDFKAPFETALKDALLPHASPESPIMEGLRMVSSSKELLTIVRRYPKATKRLMLFSDMLQNSPVASFLKSAPDVSALSGPLNPYIAEFVDYSIDVYELERPLDARHQTPAIEAFWREYFHNSSGKLSERDTSGRGRQFEMQYSRIPAASMKTNKASATTPTSRSSGATP